MDVNGTPFIGIDAFRPLRVQLSTEQCLCIDGCDSINSESPSQVTAILNQDLISY